MMFRTAYKLLFVLLPLRFKKYFNIMSSSIILTLQIRTLPSESNEAKLRNAKQQHKLALFAVVRSGFNIREWGVEPIVKNI